MPAREIFHEVRIKAPVAEVYAAITQPERLARWWIPDTRGDGREGGTLQFWLGTRVQEMDVVATVPNRLVRWCPTDTGFDDWADTRLEFEIRPVDEGSVVHFRHSGWRDDVEAFPHYSMSWAVFMLSMKGLVETGDGFPFPNYWVH